MDHAQHRRGTTIRPPHEKRSPQPFHAELVSKDKREHIKKLRRLQRELAISPSKAREMLHHGEVHGKPLSRKQRGLFGMIAGGGHPTRTR